MAIAKKNIVFDAENAIFIVIPNKNQVIFKKVVGSPKGYRFVTEGNPLGHMGSRQCLTRSSIQSYHQEINRNDYSLS